MVLWELTRACDLACLHCRATACAAPDPGELSTDEALDILDQIEAMTTPLVVLTGGDPLRRRDLEKIVAYGASLGLRMALTPSVTPLLTPAALARLQHAGLARVALSLDSPEATVHDAFRGVPGTFERTLEVAAAARSLGLSLQVNSTVCRQTIAGLSAFPPLLETLGIDLWSVFFLVPVGRGATAQVLDAEEHERAFDVLYRASQAATFEIKTTEAPHYRRYVMTRPGARTEARRVGVNDGRGVLFLDHCGEVFPSGFLPVSAGNVRHRPLAEIYREGPLFRELRDPDRLLGKCGACEFRRVCGGSRARAYAMAGDWNASEPCCAYQPGTAAAGR